MCFPNDDLKTESDSKRVRRTRCSGHLGLLAALLVVVLGLGHSRQARGQAAPEKKTVRASAQGELSRYWDVLEAGFGEDSLGTLGYLHLKNVSGTPLRDPLLYGEYFDAQGRLCFSLVFAIKESPEENDSVAPGDSRLIDGSAFGLFPGTDPQEVKLYLVQLRAGDQSNPLHTWDTKLWAPVTVKGGESTLQMAPEVVSHIDTLSDLMLARVTVGKSGTIEDTEVLQSTASQVESWFRDFVASQAIFYPATERGIPQRSESLILFRIVPDEGHRIVFVPPRMSPWVKSYLQGTKDSQPPPVTTFVFTRPPTRVQPLGSTDFVSRPAWPPGLFDLSLKESRWCEPPAHWVADPTMPHHLRREIGFSKHEKDSP